VFNRTEARKEAPPIMVLAAASNIFEGNMIQQADVRVRPATLQEVEQLKRGELLPPMVQAAMKRFAKLSIPADSAIRKDYLEDLAAPTDLRARVAPGMRAVNLAIPKHHAAGGLINVGDWVDIQLMAAIETPAVPLPGGAAAAGGTTAQAAIITRAARVIAKRNSLWPVSTPLGPDCPVNFTLETNPYRAALIEFAKDKGTLVLLPVGDGDKRVLEARRNDLMQSTNPAAIQTASYNLADSNEYREEDKRVGNFLNGNYVINEGDLVRIFQLKYVPPTPPTPERRMEKVVGISTAGYTRGVNRANASDPAEEGNAVAIAQRSGPSVGGGGGYTIGGNSASPFRFKPPEASANCNSCQSGRGKCGQK
jgi:Flp pilus assembly protein CpaB